MADRMLAEFEDEHAIIDAIARLRDEGYRRIEAYLPFPSTDVETALAQRPSRLPWVIFAFALGGAGGAYALQWFLDGFLYPLDVGGRPPHFPLAFIIITFEMGVLAAALCAYFGTLVAGRLVRLTDAVQGTPGFESVTRDRFWLEVSARDPEFDVDRTHRLLVDAGALRVELPTEVS